MCGLTIGSLGLQPRTRGEKKKPVNFENYLPALRMVCRKLVMASVLISLVAVTSYEMLPTFFSTQKMCMCVGGGSVIDKQAAYIHPISILYTYKQTRFNIVCCKNTAFQSEACFIIFYVFLPYIQCTIQKLSRIWGGGYP